MQLAEVTATAAPAGGGGVTSIDRVAIEQSGASDLADILQQQSGVVVTRAGGPGSPRRRPIRGSSANQVLVLVDGVPQNQAVSGSADLSLVRLDNVEKISVVRGAQSARYGQQALGGAIVVETRRPAGVEAQAEVGAGTYGARALAGRASVGRSTARGVAASVSGAYNDFAGDFPYDIPPERGGGTGVRLNSAVRDVSVNGAADLDRRHRRGAGAGRVLRCRPRNAGDGGAAVAQRSPDPAAVRRRHRWQQAIRRDRRHRRASRCSGRMRPSPTARRPSRRHTTTRTGPTCSWPTPAWCAPLGRWELSAGAQFQRMGISGTALSVDAPGTTYYGGGRVAARAPVIAGDWALDANAALRVDGSSVTDQWYVVAGDRRTAPA